MYARRDDARRPTVPDREALELAVLLRDAGFDGVAEKLEVAYDRETIVLALSIDAWERILASLPAIDAGTERSVSASASERAERQGGSSEP
jgi:hypothetical protein